MEKESEKEIVYKEQITHLLLLLLQIAGRDARDSEDFEEAFRKQLKFQKITDWKRFRASVDLLEDTEYAIISAFEFQLGDLRNKNRDIGERYIRLYGVLNAVYLQMNAYKEIAKLLNFPGVNKIAEKFELLDIYRLRNMAGAHTTDYRYDRLDLQNNPGIKRSTSFRIMQAYLGNTGEKIVVLDENDISLEFKLLELLAEYEKLATEILVQLINHSIKNLLYKREDKLELKTRLDELLPNLIDYTTINRNKEYREKLKRGFK